MGKWDWVLAGGLALIVGVASWLSLPAGGYDWVTFFGPAGRYWYPAPWTGGLPYLPWGALLLAPLAALSDRAATTLINSAGMIVLVSGLRRFGGRAWLAVPLVLSPFGLQLLRLGQLDLLIFGGLLLPAGLDAVLLMVKPQVAAGALIAHFARAWAAGWRSTVRCVAPLALVGLASLFIWPGWPQGLWALGRAHLPSVSNAAPWPWAIPVGMGLLWLAWRRQDDGLGILATICLVPFVNFHTFIAPMIIVAARWPLWFLAVWLVMWALFLLLLLATPINGIVAALLVLAAGGTLVADLAVRRAQRRAAQAAA